MGLPDSPAALALVLALGCLPPSGAGDPVEEMRARGTEGGTEGEKRLCLCASGASGVSSSFVNLEQGRALWAIVLRGPRAS